MDSLIKKMLNRAYNYKIIKATFLLFSEAIEFCRGIDSILWTPHSKSDFDNDRILDLLRSSGASLNYGRPG